MATVPASGVDLSANQGPRVIHAVVPVAVLATISVACRLYSRRLKKTPFASHDYLIVIGLILAWGCAIVDIIMVDNGMGKHVQVVPPREVTNLLKTLFSFIFLFDTAILTIKASIILFLLHLFPVTKVKITLYFISAIVIAWWFVTVFMGLFLCTPVSGQWNKSIPSKCISNKKYYIATAVPNTVTDIALLCIPIIEVWTLQMVRLQKVLITGIFLLGAFICAASIVRIVFLFEIGDDFTWDVTDGALWGSIEPSVGVICACLPTMLPFLESFIFKPVRRLTSSIHERLQRTSRRSEDPSSASHSSHKSADARNFQRLQDGGKDTDILTNDPHSFSNVTIVEGDDGLDKKEDWISLDAIKVRHDVDVDVERGSQNGRAV